MINTRQMQGVWLENRSLTIRNDLTIPTPNPDEALIRVLLAGICGTDVQLRKGYYPFNGIPGHEFIGEVVEAPGAPQLTGARVVGEINIGCGHCVLCNTGLSGHCRQRKVLGIKNHNGAFAEYLTLPLANLHAVPEHIPNEKAVFAEPVAAAARILEQVSIGPTSEVLVVGAGRLGLLIAQVINTTRCRLQVVARHEQQRQILGRLSIPAISEQQLPNQTADVVIEASGSPGGLQAAVHAVKPIGTIVLKSTYAGDSPFNFSQLVVDEIKLIGSRCGRFSTALTMLLSNQVNPGLLITGLYSLKDALAAFEAAAQPGALKILLQP